MRGKLFLKKKSPPRPLQKNFMSKDEVSMCGLMEKFSSFCVLTLLSLILRFPSFLSQYESF